MERGSSRKPKGSKSKRKEARLAGHGDAASTDTAIMSTKSGGATRGRPDASALAHARAQAQAKARAKATAKTQTKAPAGQAKADTSGQKQQFMSSMSSSAVADRRRKIIASATQLSSELDQHLQRFEETLELGIKAKSRLKYTEEVGGICTAFARVPVRALLASAFRCFSSSSFPRSKPWRCAPHVHTCFLFSPPPHLFFHSVFFGSGAICIEGSDTR